MKTEVTRMELRQGSDGSSDRSVADNTIKLPSEPGTPLRHYPTLETPQIGFGGAKRQLIDGVWRDPTDPNDPGTPA